MGVPRDLPPLQGLDLNLLVVLRALLREQSVTRAAEQLRSTQPTVSRALKTLRAAFSDPLLVRAGRTMVLTNLALELRVPVERALASLDRLVDLGSFDPGTAQRTFRLVMPGLVATDLLGELARIGVEAPGINFQVVGGERGALRGLLEDTIDLVYGGAILDHPELYVRQVGDPIGLRVVYGPAHPCWQTGMEQEAWLASRHVQLVPGEQPTVQSAFDRVLQAAGLTRQVRVHVSYLAGVAPLLEAGAYVASLPEPAANWVAKGRALRSERHPFHAMVETMGHRLRLTWHHSYHHDAGHRWLRQRLAEAATGLTL